MIHEPVSMERLIEGARGIARVGKEPHRIDSFAEKAPGDVAEQTPSQSHALILSQQEDLAQFAFVARLIAAHSFGEPNQLPVPALDDVAEPAPVRAGERV